MREVSGSMIDETQNGDAANAALAKGHILQQVRTSYVTAVTVQRPRNMTLVNKNIEAAAAINQEKFYYSWTVNTKKGPKLVEGGSIVMAMSLARNFGNCAIEHLPIQDLPDAWIFTASFVDLESGFTHTRPFRQGKGKELGGRYDDDRKDEMRFGIGASKAIRNVVLDALRDLAVPALAIAKEGARNTILKWIEKKGSIVKATEAMLGALEKLGVTEAAVLEKLGIADRKAIDADELLRLKLAWEAIDQGEAYADDIFPGLKNEEATKRVREKLGNGGPKFDDPTLQGGTGASSPEPAGVGTPAAPAAAPPTATLAEGEITAAELFAEDLYSQIQERLLEADTLDKLAGEVVGIENVKDLTAAQKEKLMTLAGERKKTLERRASKSSSRAPKRPEGF